MRINKYRVIGRYRGQRYELFIYTSKVRPRVKVLVRKAPK